MHEHRSYLDRVGTQAARMLASRLGTPLILSATLALAGGASALLNQPDDQAAAARVQMQIAPVVTYAQVCGDNRWERGEASGVWHGNHVTTLGLVYSHCRWVGVEE